MSTGLWIPSDVPDDERAPDEWHQTYLDAGYDFCRPCRQYHRPPECPVDETGTPHPAWLDV